MQTAIIYIIVTKQDFDLCNNSVSENETFIIVLKHYAIMVENVRGGHCTIHREIQHSFALVTGDKVK